MINGKIKNIESKDNFMWIFGKVSEYKGGCENQPNSRVIFI